MNIACVDLDRSQCVDVDHATSREWWLANGLGGYAGGTICGVLTRRYHGLLIAPIFPPLGRMLLFAKADATLLLDDREIPLHTNQWNQGERIPEGFLRLERFYLDGNIPVWRYRVDDIVIEQRIWMPHGENETCVAFRIQSHDVLRKDPPHIRLQLIASYRGHHSVNGLNSFEITSQVTDDGLRLQLPQEKAIYIYSEQGRFSTDHTWIENFFMQLEQQRGLESLDHHLCVGQLELPLSQDQWRGLAIGTQEIPKVDIAMSLEDGRQRIEELRECALPDVPAASIPAWISQLVVAADSYLFMRTSPEDSSGYSLIAGYPWFGDWGRDTMIALPGLCLATGRHSTLR